MAEVVQLKAIDPLPQDGDYLVITRLGRARAFEYFIDVSPSLQPRIGPRVPPGGPGYATLESALTAAQALAQQHKAPRIYVQHASILVRPFYPGSGPLRAVRPTSRQGRSRGVPKRPGPFLRRFGP